MRFNVLTFLVVLPLMLMGCQGITSEERYEETAVPTKAIKVMAVESFIADMAQNVAGDRVKVETLIPLGMDPHAFEPTPQDIVKISHSEVIIINGAGFEPWMDKVLDSVGGERLVIDASAGLAEDRLRESDQHDDPSDHQDTEENEMHHHEGDPHFWLSPHYAVEYVHNIRDGLIQADPEGAPDYEANAKIYIEQIVSLDQWVQNEVQKIPEQKRLLVTNHESFGYFAERYHFSVVGTIIPGANSDAEPSAQQLTQLIRKIKESGAPAIFLETTSNPQMADLIAKETGVKVVTDLYTHSITGPEGNAPTYLDMIRYNTMKIVGALE